MLSVSETLYNALHHLRQRGMGRILWVNHICINQANYHEKQEQVSQMPDIYREAESVVVYLGEATKATGQAMDYLRQTEESLHIPWTVKLSEVTGGGDDFKLEGMRDILSRPWFQRLWMYQEVFHARAVILHCGSKGVHSKALIRASEGLLDKTSLTQKVLELMPGSNIHDRAVTGFQLHDLLQRFRQAHTTDPRDKIYALLSMVDNNYSRKPILPDYSLSEKDVMRQVIAYLCFCEWSSVPEPSYDTIEAFLSNLDTIDNDIVKHIFEFSLEIDVESLLRHGSHYIRIDHSLIAAAGRNTTRGDEMVELLLRAIRQERSTSPSPSEAESVFSDLSAPTTNTSYPPEDVEISVWHVVEIMLSRNGFVDLCQRGFQREDLEPDRFANNLRRLLKTFGKKLQSEGQSHIARRTAQLIVRGSRRMATLIRVRHDSSYDIGPELPRSKFELHVRDSKKIAN